MNPIFQAIRRVGFTPTVRIPNPDWAVPIAKALIAGGVNVIEVLNRDGLINTGDAIRNIRQANLDIVVGAGTITDLTDPQTKSHTFKYLLEAGAQFFVSPGATPQLLVAASDLPVPYIPGGLTPSDMLRLQITHWPVVKLFPMKALADGPGTLAEYQSIYRLKYIVSGGVGENKLADYFKLPSVLAIATAHMTTSEMVLAQNWSAITEAARRAVKIRDEARVPML